MRLEELIAWPGRLRIVAALIEHGELNITRLVRMVGLSYVAVRKHLRVLAQHGLVRERRVGRVRLVRVELGRPEVRLLRSLLREWKGLKETRQSGLRATTP